jgi:hypothetical protein
MAQHNESTQSPRMSNTTKEVQGILDALEQRPDVKAAYVNEVMDAMHPPSEALILQLFQVPEVRLCSKQLTAAEFVALMKQVSERLLAN